MGASSANYVVLEMVDGLAGGYGPSKVGFVRNLSNGTVAAGGWSIPPGQALLVRDVDWQYIYLPAANSMQILRLFLVNPASPLAALRVFESAVQLNGKGEGGGTFSMANGCVVAANASIGVDVMPGPMGPPFGLQHLLLRGVLIMA